MVLLGCGNEDSKSRKIFTRENCGRPYQEYFL